jgi:hypothetical protein
MLNVGASGVQAQLKAMLQIGEYTLQREHDCLLGCCAV